MMVVTGPITMRTCIVLFPLSLAAVLTAGCASLAGYQGDGRIRRGTDLEQLRVVVELPPIDIAKSSEHTYQVSGLPSDYYVVTLHDPTGRLTMPRERAGALVHVTLTDLSTGEVVFDGGGSLSRGWTWTDSRYSLSPTAWIPTHWQSSTRYELRFVVEAEASSTESATMLQPRVSSVRPVMWP